jgi:hypothetical protein
MRRLIIAAGAALVGMVFVPSAGAVATESVPFRDPAATGTITLCDTLGHVATHGNIHVKPFIWRAVGSTRPPAGYDGKGRIAALYGYQPIKDVAPGQWNGEFLTAGGQYTSRSRPMAPATPVDPSLADLMDNYPPKWDGLIQLRLFVGAPRQPTLTSPYDAATLKITGTTWTLLDGGRDGCGSGTARSVEMALPSIARMPTPAPNATTDTPVSGGQRSPARGTPTTNAASASALRPGGSTESQSQVASSRPTSSGPSRLPWLIGVGIVAAAAAGALLWWRRQWPGRHP